MIEEQFGDRMRAVLADEPPLGFDPDELVDRAGRARRRRRSTVAAGGATVAVLVIAVAAVVATGSGGDRRTAVVGTPPSSTADVPATAAPQRCQKTERGQIPPMNFDGSAQIVARLNEAAPRAIATHLPGVVILPSETGMIAYDCPPNVGTSYRVAGVDQTVSVYLIHARDELDLGHDPYADDSQYQRTNDDVATDGARIRTYEYKGGGVLSVLRFGRDGMITEASVSGQGTPVADGPRLRALASDPELRF